MDGARMSIFRDTDTQQAREWAVGKTALTKPTGFGENIASAWDAFNTTDASGALRDQMRSAYDQRIRTIQELTGAEVESPFQSIPSWLQPATEGMDPDRMGPIGRLGLAIPDPVQAAYWLFDWKDGGNEYQRREAHEREIDRIRDSLPESQRHLIPTLEDIEKSISEAAQGVEQANADIASRATGMGIVGQILGSMGAATLQPEVLLTLPIGAPARVGLLSRVLIEASIGAGVETAIQPGIQSQRDQLGLESGFEQGLTNVLAAGAGGGAFAVGAAGVGAILRGGKSAFRRLFGRDPDPGEEAAIDLARQATDAERSTPYQERTAASAQVFEANEAAATMAALEGRAITTRELAQSPEVTQRYVSEGLNLRVLTNADLDAIGVDADLMQFKSGGDEFGVTDRLQGIKEWDAERAGIGLVYEYADGRQIIADGHQRLGLARRLASEGQKIEMPVYVIRELDGFSPEEARARAAFKNIAEGTGTATDAAKILRDMGATAEDLGLPPKSALVRDAEGLSRVNDDVFGMVINDMLPDRFAAIIGRYVNDPHLQTNIAQLLARLQPANVLEAEQIVDQARRAGVSRGTQTTLFGEEDIAESLYLERARVLDRAQKMLRRNATTFRTLLDQEGEITGAGNRLDQSSNAARLEADQRLMAYVRAQANRKGLISDALTDAARAAKDAGQYQQPAREFLETLSRTVADGGDLGAAGRGDGPAFEPAAQDRSASGEAGQSDIVPDENTLAMFDEPVGDAAQEQTDRIARELSDEVRASSEGLDQPSVGQPVYLRNLPVEAEGEILYNFKMDAPELTVEQLAVNAQKWQGELSRLGKMMGRRKGVEFRDPGTKSLEGINEKMVRKNYRDVREVTDATRGGFIIETPAQALGIVRTLAERFRVIDEGWNVTPAGYFDRKVLVKFDDGTVGEVQIWHPDMLKIKDRAGHKIYEQMRKLEFGSPEYERLLGEQRKLYGEIIDQFDEDWRSVVEDFVSGAGGRAGNIRENTSGATTRPDSETSSTRAGSQSSESSGMTQASEPDINAGRPSQDTNVTDTGGAPDVEPGAEGLPQILMPGVRAVTDGERISIEIGRGLDGGNSPMDIGLFGDDVNQSDLLDMLRQPQDTLADMEVPIGERIDADGNRVAQTGTIGQVLADLEADQEFIEQLDLCDRQAST